MRRYILTTILLLTVFFVFGQELRYETCTNCQDNLGNQYAGSMSIPAGGFTYNGTVQSLSNNIQHITSDFGRRGANSRWHIGVDIQPQGGNTTCGDRIYPIEAGTIVRLKGEGSYKVIVIRGNQRFGYGHIFFDGDAGSGNGIRSGDFILKRMDAPQADSYAIIYAPDGGNSVAFSDTEGEVTHPSLNNGQPITVTNQITNINTPIAPIGNSGGNFAAHIHLYNFENDPVDDDFNSRWVTQTGSRYTETRFRNPKDPLQFVDYPPSAHTLNIQTNLIAAGDDESSIRVRTAMNGATPGVVYPNAVMDIDDVELFIKKSYESDNAYQYIKGPFLESKMSLGARLASDRYPSYEFPNHNNDDNALIEIADRNRVGSFNGVTGIDAYAYNGNPWDDYYFSDFRTRIHRDDDFGQGNAQYARLSQEARYPDGQYTLYAKATTVRNIEHESNPVEITIDNFLPYVKEVIVRKNNENGSLVYVGRWQWNGSQLSIDINNGDDAGAFDNLWIKVITSEPMANLTVSIPDAGTSYAAGAAPVANTNDQEFVVTFGPITEQGLYGLVIEGEDLAGNAFSSNPSDLAIHQSDGTWLTAGGSSNVAIGIDQNHFFNAGTNVCTSPGGRLAATCPLIADFSSVISNSNPLRVNFTDRSYPEGEITGWQWSFGDGSTSSDQNAAHTYAQSGTYSVKLTVRRGSEQVSETQSITVTGSSNPGGGNDPSGSTIASFKWEEPVYVDQGTDFRDASVLACPNGARWIWKITNPFGSTDEYSSEDIQYPFSVTGPHIVQMCVTDGCGKRSCFSKTVNVQVYQTGVHAAFTTNKTLVKEGETVTFFDNSYPRSKIKQWVWNFEYEKDGVKTRVNEGNSKVLKSYQYDVQHRYANPGKYKVRLYAQDDIGNQGSFYDAHVNVLKNKEYKDDLISSSSYNPDYEGITVYEDYIVAPSRNSGQAYVYKKGNSSWIRVATLRTSDGGAIHRTAMYGNTIVCSGLNKLYIYEKGSSEWSSRQETEFISLPKQIRKIDFQGNTIAVAVNFQEVYIYEKSSNGWSNNPTAIIDPGINNSLDIALDGNTVVVGYLYNQVVVIEKQGTWKQVAYWLADETLYDDEPTDLRMCQVAIDNNTIVVGAIDEAKPQGSNDLRAVYVYEKPSRGWSDNLQSIAKLVNSGERDHFFARDVTISGKNIIAYGGYGMYLFEKPEQGWRSMNSETIRLLGDNSRWANNGEVVAYESRVVSTDGYTGDNGSVTSMYIYDLDAYYTEPCISEFNERNFIAAAGENKEITSGKISVRGTVRANATTKFTAIETVLRPGFHAQSGSTLFITPTSCGEIYHQLE